MRIPVHARERKTVLLIVALIISMVSFAQSSAIQGYVYDKSNHAPIANAAIKINGTKTGAISDSTGMFALSGTKSENVAIHISCIGYASIDATAKVQGENIFLLQEKNQDLNGVEIISRRKNSIKETTEQPQALQSAIQTITTEQIQETGAVNVIEAMKYTTSGSFTMQGRKRKNFISLRGQSMDYAIDGVSLYNFMDAPNALSSNMVEEVDVNRSSNALLMGYSGLSGVANY